MSRHVAVIVKDTCNNTCPVQLMNLISDTLHGITWQALSINAQIPASGNVKLSILTNCQLTTRSHSNEMNYLIWQGVMMMVQTASGYRGSWWVWFNYLLINLLYTQQAAEQCTTWPTCANSDIN